MSSSTAKCGSIGPRIGDQAPRCVLAKDHEGPHVPHSSWLRTIRYWSDIRVGPATRQDVSFAPDLAALDRQIKSIHTIADRIRDDWAKDGVVYPGTVDSLYEMVNSLYELCDRKPAEP